MLIIDIEHYEAILSKLWMNKNEILLNMKHDTIVFFKYFYFYFFNLVKYKALKLIMINFYLFSNS